MGKYLIQCPICEGDQYPAHKTYDNEFMCHNCNTIFSEGDIVLINIEDVERYKMEFRGAKIAGMIPEKEFIGDREQMKAERW